MMRRITILFLIVIFTFLLTISAFALTKKEQAWKEDILTLLSLVKRVGDYSEVVDLIEVAPALKEDPEIRKAFITFTPPGATPPEWAKGKEPVLPAKIEIPKEIPVEVKEEPAPPAIVEVPEKIVTAEAQKEQRRREKIVTAEAQKEKERRGEEEKEARRIAREVAAQRKAQEKEAAPPEIIKEEPKIEAPKEVAIIEGPPEKIATAKAARKALEEQRAKQKEKERREMEEEAIKEELGVIPTPLPPGAKVIHSTDVVSGVRAEMVEGKMRVTITLSGERKYTASERGRPPAIVIDIPHTINAVSPERIVVNQEGVRTIEVTQHCALPFDETRIVINLSRFKEYEIKGEENEIYVEFEE